MRFEGFVRPVSEADSQACFATLSDLVHMRPYVLTQHPNLCSPILETDTWAPLALVWFRTRPCNHEGSCSVAECECHRNKVYCTINCHCSPSDCPRRHPGCNCKGKGTAKCQTRSCKCFQDGRECDPLLCGSCGARGAFSPLSLTFCTYFRA